MNPTSDSLFHFTRHLKVFKLILERGLRYSFSFEQFQEAVISNIFTSGCFTDISDDDYDMYRGIAIPMVSFCDIPLLRIGTHSKKYGRYAIGLDKRALSSLYDDFINPVVYADSRVFYRSFKYVSGSQGQTIKLVALVRLLKAENPDIERQLKSVDIDTKAKEYSFELNQCIHTLASLFKPTYGKDVYGKEVCFYDEHEWRAIQPNFPKSEFEWEIGITRDRFLSIKDELNMALDNSPEAFLKIPNDMFNAVTNIIVPTEKIARSIIKFIFTNEKLLGSTNIALEQRLSLISKVTSFERIFSNY